MTARALERVLKTTDAHVTLAINGGESFAVPAHERLNTVYWPKRESLGIAYNLVANATNSRFICFVHNDCLVPEDDWLPKLTAVAEQHGFAFPEVVVDWQEAAERGIGGLGRLADTLPPSCCYVVSREAWNDLGGFSDEFEGCHFEDTDLFMRALRVGYRLAHVPSVTVEHRRGFTRSQTTDESNTAFVKNRAIYNTKWTKADGRVMFPGLWKESQHGGLMRTANSVHPEVQG